MKSLRDLVEEQCEVVRWTSDQCEIVCPGADSHTDANKRTATVFINSGWPVVTCFHQGCRHEVAALQAELSEAAEDSGIEPEKLEVRKAERELRKRYRRLEANAKHKMLPMLLRYPVPMEEWAASSPVKVSGIDVEEQWKYLLRGLFVGLHGDRSFPVWIGELWETGDQHAEHFKTPTEWLKRLCPPGPQWCPALLRPAALDRCAAQVLMRPFVVVESDKLTREEFGAIIKFLSGRWALRWVVDTGSGRSLHAGFDRPALKAGEWPENVAVLRGLGCDPAMLKMASTTRLPGVRRFDKEGNLLGWQRLLYLNPACPL